jgi:hypothetical protein
MATFGWPLLSKEIVMKSLLDLINQDPALSEALAIKPQSKTRIRAYSKAYYAWVKRGEGGKQATSAIKQLVAKKKAATTDCQSCDGSGVYIGETYSTRCARCKGKGHMTLTDHRTYSTWTEARSRGLPHTCDDMGASHNL